MRMVLAWMAGLALGLPLAGEARGQALEPVMVLSVASQQRLWDVLKHVGTHSGEDKFVEVLSDLIAKLGKMEGFSLGPLPGVDKDRPWVLTYVPDGEALALFGFVPISAEAEAIAAFKPILGEPVNEDGVYVAQLSETNPLGALTLYLKAHEGWLFGTTSRALLDTLPDPAAVLGEAAGDDFLVVRLELERASDAQKQALIGQFSALMASAAADEAADPQQALEAAVARSQQEVLETVLGESQSIHLRMNVDIPGDKIIGSVTIVPRTETTLARHLAKMSDPQPSRFAHLASSGDPLSLHVNLSLEPDQVSRLQQELAAYEAAVTHLVDTAAEVAGDEERDVLKRLAARFFGVARATLDTGHLNLAAKMTGKRVPYSGVLAIQCSQADQLAAAIEELAELAKNDPGFTEVAVDVAQVDGARIHAFTLAEVKGSRELELLTRLFRGRKLHVAVGGDCVCVGVGPSGLDLVKEALTQPGGEAAPVHLVAGGGAMMAVGAPLVSVPALQTALPIMAMNLTRGSSGEPLNDTSRLVVQPGSDALRAEFELGNGYLRLFGTMVPLLGLLANQQGAGGFNF